MIIISAKLQIKEGSEEEAAKTFDRMAPLRRQEEGNLIWMVIQSRSDARQFQIIEVYRDGDAVKAHMENVKDDPDRVVIAKLVDGNPEITVNRRVAGGADAF